MKLLSVSTKYALHAQLDIFVPLLSLAHYVAMDFLTLLLVRHQSVSAFLVSLGITALAPLSLNARLALQGSVQTMHPLLVVTAHLDW